MNPEINRLNLLSLAPDKKGETGAECEIILPDYCPNILRILQSTAHPVLHTAVRSGDRLNAEGSVEYQILYLSEDGTVQSICQQAPFHSTTGMQCTDDCDFKVTVTPKNCIARALNSKKIHARCSLSVGIKINQTQTLPIPDLPGECERKTCTKKAARHLCSAKKPLRISDEWEPDATKTIFAVLQSNVQFRETEQKILTDKLIVKGDMTFDLLCADQFNTPFPVQKTLPISQILDLPGIVPGVVCKTDFEPLSLSVTLRDDATDQPKILCYDVEVQVSADAYTMESVEWTEDVYSVAKTVDCTRESVSTETFTVIEESGAIRETVDVGTCTSLLWMEVNPELRGTYYRPEDDKVVCEGVWNCRILMTDGDGTPCCTQREIPFTLQTPSMDCKNPVRNDTTLLLSDCSWNLTDASHVEVRGTYHWKGLIFGRERSDAVVSVTEKEIRPKCADAVVLYYGCKGESAWDIAKEQGCPYAELIRSNRLEQDQLTEDKMLVIVRC